MHVARFILALTTLAAPALPRAASPQSWTPLNAATPEIAATSDPGRMQAASVYDPVRGLVIAIGGVQAGPALIDVSTLDPSMPGRWQTVAVQGGPPPGRYGHVAIYDPLRDRIIIHGGRSVPQNGLLSDVWALDLTVQPWQWSRLYNEPVSAKGSAALDGEPYYRLRCFDHVAIYDPVRDCMVIQGGQSVWAAPEYDLWSFSLTTNDWTQLGPPFNSAMNNLRQSGHSAIYDPAADRMIVTAGVGVVIGNPQLSAFDLSSTPPTFHVVSTSRPLVKYAAAAHDGPGSRLLLFGGELPDGSRSADVWSFDLAGSAGWTLLSTLGSGPGPRSRMSAAWDPQDRRWIVGRGASGSPAAPVEDGFSLDVGTSPAAWTEVSPNDYEPGSGPIGRSGATMVADPAHDRMLLFGGTGADGSISSGLRVLSLSSPAEWTLIPYPLGGPFARSGHTAMLDPARNRVLFSGGLEVNSDVWALDLETLRFSPVPAVGAAPSTKFGCTATYDPVRDRMIVFGGAVSSNQMGTWYLDFTLSPPRWYPMSFLGPRPPARTGHVTVYDPARDRFLVFGGLSAAGTAALGDTWEMTPGAPGEWTTWRQITATGASPRAYAQGLFDPLTNRMLVLGGYRLNSGSAEYLSDAKSYGVIGEHWTDLAIAGAAPAARRSAAMGFDPASRRAVVFGGTGAAGGLSDTWALDLGAFVAVGDDAREASFAVHGFRPNPAIAGRVVVSFSLARTGRAELSLHDLQGRAVARRDLGMLAAGRHQAPLAETFVLPAGLYWIVLRQGDESVMTRGVLIR